MTTPAFAVRITDLEKGPKDIAWVLPVEWIGRVLEDTDARPRTEGKLEVQVSLNGREVLVRGRITVALTMPCARTLEPIHLDLTPELVLLLEPAPSPSVSLSASKRNRSKGSPPRGHRSPEGWQNDAELSAEDAGRDIYEGEEVVLDHFVREFILLELPIAPYRTDLHSAEDAANPLVASYPGTTDGPSIDPRLAPLADMASRLRQKKE